MLVLLDAGIDVLTTMNIQHLESLNDQMREITGVQVRETIPDWVVKQADEVVLVDLPPRALLNRLQRGVIYGTDKAERAMENFFKESTLGALREMALRQTAHEVDLRQVEDDPVDSTRSGLIGKGRADSDSRHRIARRGRVDPPRKTRGRLPEGGLFRGMRAAHRRNGAVSNPAREAIEHHLDFARKLHIETRVLEGANAAETLVDFARQHAVTQIFLSKPPARALPFLRENDLVMQIVRLATDRQVTVVAERRQPL